MGGCPPPPLSEKRVNLQLQLIKFLGMTRVFQPTNSFGSLGYSNQSRKRNKRNPNWKRSKTLTVCR